MDSVVGQLQAVRRGLGIFAIAKEFPFIEEMNLIPILPEELAVKFEVYFIRREDIYPSDIVEDFYNFLKNYLTDFS